MGDKKVKIEVSDETTRAIAARHARGISLRDLEIEFGMSRPVISRVLASDSARATIKDICFTDAEMQIAKNRRAVADLLPTAIEVLKNELMNEKTRLKAAELVIRSSGIMNTDGNKEQKQDASITVILPGQYQQPKDVKNDIEVK
jgi:transcriptional regulator with XRE-family HTH domain